MTRRESAVALSAFVALGLAAGLGASWPQAHRDLHVEESLLGIVMVAMTATYFAGAAAAGRLLARFGAARLVAVSALIAAGSFAGVAATPVAAAFVVASAVLNAALAAIDAGLNAHVAVRGGLRRLGWLHAVWAVGATAGPAVVAITELAFRSWRPAFVVFGVVMLGVAVAATRTPWSPLTAPGAPRAETRRAARWMFVAAALLLAATAVEVAFGLWSPTDLSHRGFSSSAAAAGGALFYGGLTAGRVVVGAAAGLESHPVKVLLAGAGLAAAAALAYVVGPRVALVLLPLAGLALGPMVPVVNVLTVRRLGATGGAVAVGWQMAIGIGVGGLIPSSLGLVVQVGGPEVLAPAFAVGSLALLVLTIAAAPMSHAGG